MNDENSEQPKSPAKRKLTLTDIKAVARLCARGLTESEACRQLGWFEPKAWFVFKSRGKNDSRFEAELEKLKAERIDYLIGTIEKSAAGENMKQRDWRAGQYLLTTMDKERFSDSPKITTNQSLPLDGLQQLAQLGINAAQLLMEGSMRAREKMQIEKQIVDIQPTPKLLSDKQGEAKP